MKLYNNFSVFALNRKSPWLKDQDQEMMMRDPYGYVR